MSRPDTAAYAIEVRALSKSYGGKLVIDDLSFVVEPGTVTGFLGPNGSGKSTTMRLIVGLDRPARSTRAGPARVCPRATLRRIEPKGNTRRDRRAPQNSKT